MPDAHRLEKLRDQLDAEQVELRCAVAELETAARRTLDPREWIRAHPVVWLGSALVLGAWLGARRR